MRVYQRAKKQLPVAGGYDVDGKLTTDPAEIFQSQRALPIGLWKGSGLSIMLDLMAAILSGGNTTFRIGKLGAEKEVSQVFIAIDTGKISNAEFVRKIMEKTIASVNDSQPANKGDAVYYPGQRMLMTRTDNLENGITVDEEIWGQVLGMCK
jgi:3-dehydro-L-gulonate 2-dehydrogenase